MSTYQSSLPRVSLKRLASLVVLTASLLVLPRTGAATSTSAATEIEAYLAQCHLVGVCNGSYLVSVDGRVILETAFGSASADGAEVLTPEHAFDIGSISKQFTAMAILRLSEQGKLDLDDQLVSHLPEFPYPQVTVRHLLTHTSGVPDLMPVYGKLLKRDPAAGPILLDNAAALLAGESGPQVFAAGTRFEYSNTGYLLLADVIERSSGVSYARYLEREFFEPLELTNTQVRMPDADVSIKPRAFGFRIEPDGQRRAFDQIPRFYMRGAGGIYSTARDLHKWTLALQQGRVVSRTSWHLATNPTLLNDGSITYYGFGFNLKPSLAGHPRISHGGHWRAFKADLTSLPEKKVIIVQLTNNGEDDSVERTRDAIEAILAGAPRTEVQQPLHLMLQERLERDESSHVQRWLIADVLTDLKRHDVREDALNALGYDLLKRKRIDQAVVVFAFNASAHPNSFNAQDSLADGYLEQGDRLRALRAVRRMVELKPDSSLARKRLAALENPQ